MNCPLNCGTDIEPRAVETCATIFFICPECLGVSFDAAGLCDPRRPIDLSRLLRPIIEKIRRENSIDPLTQIKNRAFFFRRLSAEIAAARHRTFISVAAFAIDLNRLYAEHGSTRGDKIMQSLAASLLSSIRTGDDFARVEPDVFGLILKNADEVTAIEIALRIAKSVRVIAPGNGHPLDISIRVAAAAACGKEADNVWTELINRLTRTNRNRNGERI